MTIVIQIEADDKNLAHLITAEKMGLVVTDVQVWQGDNVQKFNNIIEASNFILKFWGVIKGFF